MAFPNDRWMAQLLANRPRIETFISLTEAYGLACAAQGRRRVLEVGSAWGFSTVLLAQQGCMVYAVDPHEDFHSADVFAGNLRRYGVAASVVPIRQRSQEALPPLPEHTFDLMFIDGDHSEEVASCDCRQALRLVRPGGIIAVHDYTPRWPGVLQAVRRELRELPCHWLLQTLYLAVR